MDAIIEKVRALGKDIQADERYIKIDTARKNCDADAKLQEQIEAFNMKRVELSQEINKEEKNAEKLTALDKELKDLYQEVMENPNMVAFNEAKHELDAMMTFINEILMGAVNGEDPATIEHQEGCGGNCASCGGCH